MKTFLIYTEEDETTPIYIRTTITSSSEAKTLCNTMQELFPLYTWYYSCSPWTDVVSD